MTKIQRKRFSKWMQRLRVICKKKTKLSNRAILQLTPRDAFEESFLAGDTAKEAIEMEMSYWSE